MPQMSEIDAEIDRNYDAFRRVLGQHLSTHRGKIALLKSGEIVDFFDKVSTAESVGQSMFADGLFSLQPVEAGPIDLGFYSHVGG